MGLTRPRFHQLKESDYKNSCRVATTTNVTLSGGTPATVDGVNLQVNDRVLVTAQTTASQNGIYFVSTLGSGSNGTWTRALDANENSEVSAGLMVNVDEGSTHGDTSWRLVTDDPIVIGSTNLEFRQGSNSNIYNGNVSIGTATTLVDSVPTSGNVAVRWFVTAKDNTNSRYRSTVIDTVNDGSEVFYSEYSSVKSNDSYEVAEFTSNIAGGSLRLYAIGDSASVAITYQRTTLGSSTTSGYTAANVVLGGSGGVSDIVEDTTPQLGGNLDLNSYSITGNGSINISGNIIPAANVTYNLGSNSYRWNDIYLANSTIYLGEASISSNGGALILPDVTSIGNITLDASSGTLSLPSTVNIGNSTISESSGTITLPANTAIGGSAVATPRISSIDYPGDDTAANTAGGQTLAIVGAGFQSGASVILDGTTVGVVTFVSSTRLEILAPVKSSGSYILYVINPDGGTGIFVPGVQYSGVPAWSTAAGNLGSYYETNSVNNTLSATSDSAVTYSLYSGTLPPGSSLNSSTGLLSGTAELTAGNPVTYNFTIRATDAEQQETDRSFSLTINPDVVTWSSPTNGGDVTVSANSASSTTLVAASAAGDTVNYTANTLPTGLSLSGNIISGTATIVGNTSVSFTATGNTTTRSSTITVNFVVAVGGDPYFNLTTLAINGDSNTFIKDASTNNFAVSITGDTRPSALSPYNTSWSVYVDGSDDLNAASNAAFTYGTADFTIEGWFYVTGRSGGSDYEYFFAQGATTGASSLGLYRQGNVLKVWQGAAALTGTTAFSTLHYNRWVHIALTRSGTTMRLFLNGALEGSATNSGNITTGTTSGISIGRWTEIGDGNYITGYVSNFRVVKGSAVYTSAFTPPTSSLTAISGTSLLTCQSNRLIDNSTNAFTVTRNGDTKVLAFGPFTETDTTTGSGYFDGTGDYLTLAGSSAFVFGTGDFTIEAWIYIPVNQAQYSSILGNSSNPDGWFLSFSTSNIVNFSNYNVTALASSSGVPLNTWTHIAVARSGTSLKMFFNGAQVASATNSTTYGVSATTYIGFNGTSYYISGYVADVRIIKGTAVYTANFTPPTSPLTAIANTQVLTLQNRQPVNNHSFIDESGLKNIVTRVGNPSQGSFSPYSPAGWSNYFDGSGDFLSLTGSSATNFNGVDWTVECWFYKTALSGGNEHIIQSTTGTNNWIPYLGLGLNNNLTVFASINATQISSSQSYSLNTWNHLAMVRSGGVVKVYLNGTATSISVTSDITSTNLSFWFGKVDNAPGGGSYLYYFNGYLSNLRMVKGTAVYTSNFTPPTIPLTAIANTALLTCQSNRLIDNSTNAFTITRNGDTKVVNFSPFRPTEQYSLSTHGGSAYFDGSDYLQTNSTDSGLITTGPFTFEAWIYPLTLNNYIISRNYWQTGDNGGWNISTTSSGYLSFGYTNGVWNSGAGLTATSNPILINQWNHIAVTRDTSNTLRLFVHGKSSVTPVTVSQSMDTVVAQQAAVQARTLRIGVGGPGDGAIGGYYTGYISSIKIQNGVGKYTENFTPALQTFSAESGVNLLTNMNHAGVVDVSSRNVLETVGDAKIVTSTRKYGTGSMSFDGSGDYLVIPATNAPCQFGTADFTIEAWIYSTSIANQQMILSNRIAATGTTNFGLQIYQSKVRMGNQSTDYLIGTITLSSNTWYHVAVSRVSGTFRLFINGVLDVANTSAQTMSSNSITVVSGDGSYSPTSYPFIGYIDDLRITRGLGRYTENFTPPTDTFLIK